MGSENCPCHREARATSTWSSTIIGGLKMTEAMAEAFRPPRGNAEITATCGTFIAARVMPGCNEHSQAASSASRRNSIADQARQRHRCRLPSGALRR